MSTPCQSAMCRGARTKAQTGFMPGRGAIVACVIGNSLEWFDFLAFVFLSKTIAHVFFPSQNSIVSLALAFATFALGFMARPIGGVVLSLYTDRVGRARALSLVMLMMGTSSLMVGLAPGYKHIGLAAPLLVLLARLVQGLAIGAQFGMSSVIVVERAPAGRKMFYGSFNMSGQMLSALLMAGFCYLLTAHLSANALDSWGWRIPFLLGAIAGPVGLLIKRYLAEPPQFERARHAAQDLSRPLWERAGNFMRSQGDAAICGIGVMIIGTASSYLWHAYMTVYAVHQLGLPRCRVARYDPG